MLIFTKHAFPYFGLLCTPIIQILSVTKKEKPYDDKQKKIVYLNNCFKKKLWQQY